MKHDELLEELNYAVQEYDKAYDNTNYYYTALRAVVKLHKPIFLIVELSQTKSGVEAGMKQICELDQIHYPCPTIQAIEKELG